MILCYRGVYYKFTRIGEEWNVEIGFATGSVSILFCGSMNVGMQMAHSLIEARQ